MQPLRDWSFVCVAVLWLWWLRPTFEYSGSGGIGAVSSVTSLSAIAPPVALFAAWLIVGGADERGESRHEMLGAVASMLLLASPVAEPALLAGTSCASLSALTLPNATITLAQAVDAGPFTAPGAADDAARPRALPAFCRVAATLKPTADSDIKVEVWMPASGWNGKYQAVGNGAFNGSIAYPAMMTALATRLRDQLHRHRPHRQQRALRARPSREGDRLRLARGPRDDAGVEDDHRGLLRRAARSSRTGTAARPADARR